MSFFAVVLPPDRLLAKICDCLLPVGDAVRPEQATTDNQVGDTNRSISDLSPYSDLIY